MGGEEEKRLARAAFAAAFKRLRDATGATVNDVAAEFGVTRAAVDGWLTPNGRHRPRTGWEQVIARMARDGAGELTERRSAAMRLAAELDPAAPV